MAKINNSALLALLFRFNRFNNQIACSEQQILEDYIYGRGKEPTFSKAGGA